MDIFGLSNCYYIHAAFHGPSHDDYGKEITIWDGMRGNICVKTRHGRLHEVGIKHNCKTEQEAIDIVQSFVNGDYMTTNDKLILYTPDGTIKGHFNSMDELSKAALEIFLKEKIEKLHVAREVSTLSLGVAVSNIVTTREGQR